VLSPPHGTLQPHREAGASSVSQEPGLWKTDEVTGLTKRRRVWREGQRNKEVLKFCKNLVYMQAHQQPILGPGVAKHSLPGMITMGSGATTVQISQTPTSAANGGPQALATGGGGNRGIRTGIVQASAGTIRILSSLQGASHTSLLVCKSRTIAMEATDDRLISAANGESRAPKCRDSGHSALLHLKAPFIGTAHVFSMCRAAQMNQRSRPSRECQCATDQIVARPDTAPGH